LKLSFSVSRLSINVLSYAASTSAGSIKDCAALSQCP
jgi:hypothetical protein